MDTFHKNITGFFDELLNDLKCHDDTKNYIIGIYGKYKSAELDLSKDSITLLLAQGRDKQDFFTYQNLGDWLFYMKSLFPAALKDASENYYDSIAQLSYYKCYRMIKAWRIYEELADKYVILTQQARSLFTKKNLINITKDISSDKKYELFG